MDSKGHKTPLKCFFAQYGTFNSQPRACDRTVDTPLSSVLQEKDITPDPQLLDKFNDCSSQMDFMRFHNQPVTQLPSDLADITDFFIALTICNTVVVSSPNQPRQKVRLVVTLPVRLAHT